LGVEFGVEFGTGGIEWFFTRNQAAGANAPPRRRSFASEPHASNQASPEWFLHTRPDFWPELRFLLFSVKRAKKLCLPRRRDAPLKM
jgi:hypothetical protein